MYRTVMVVCCVAIAALVAATLRGPGRPGGQADFTFNNGPEVNSLDPHVISWKHDIRIANALFEGLMAFKVAPPHSPGGVGQLGLTLGAAERYEVSPDGRTYTFHLRPGACWSNGQPLTAAHFRFSWQRVMTPLTGADYAGMMFVIEGARDYYEALAAGRPADFDRVGIRAPDDHTLVVTLAAPTGYFLELTAFPPFFPVYPPLLQSFVRDDSPPAQNGIAVYDERWTRPEHLVCNGPFVLAGHWFKREMVLERNPAYWDRDAVALRRVVATAIEDQTAALNAYESGQCAWIDSIPQGAARGLVETPAEKRRPDFVRVTSFGTYYYRFNCQAVARGQRNPFADPRVRRAFAMAVDKADIVKVAGLHQPVAQGFIPPGLTVSDPAGRTYTYVSAPGLPYDVAAARQLLAEAGYLSAAELGEVCLMYNKGYGHEPIAERLASVWRQALGANVVLDKKDANVFGQALKKKENKEWHLGRSGWFGDYRDPSTFLELLMTGDGNNDCGYSNPVFDALLREAASTDDQARRMDLFRRAEDLAVVKEAAILPLYHYVEHYLVHPSVRGAWPNQMGYMLLKDVSVTR